MLPNFLRTFARSARNVKRSPTTRRILALERLEERQLLTAVPTLTSVQVSAAALIYGQTETLTATVTVAPPNTGTPTGGTVTFLLNGSSSLGTAPLQSGTATLQVSTLQAGTDVVMANYSGSGNFTSSTTVIGPNSVITTIAGNGTAGYSGNTGQATAAELHNSSNVALDTAGNVFIADTGNNQIREVNHATGVITTIAGNGTAGYAGDNGPATAAELSSPYGVAVDSAGDLFIADYYNNRIREVNHTTGVITTVAGCSSITSHGDGLPATAADLYLPTGVAVDAAGNLFIADLQENRIREVNLSTGIITTVAGNGTAGFSGDNGPATVAELDKPDGVAVDAAGNIFISDFSSRVREVDRTTGVITTVAGNGTAGFSGDNGPATAAELNYQFGVTVDAAGNLYIGDFYNNRIRVVNVSTGVITAVVGNGTAGFSGDNSPATAAEMNCPFGVAMDAGGDIFVADTNNERIREVSAGVPVSVARAPLTVTANNANKLYGTPDPAFSVSYSGFVNDENSSNLGGTLAFSTTEPASGYSPAGTYQITPSGLTSLNYAITFASGTLTVNPAATKTIVGTAASSLGRGQSLTLTATVKAGLPSAATPTGGTITFLTGNTSLGAVTLNSGTATLQVSTLPVGTDVVTASYSGSANFVSSTTVIGPNSVITTIAGNGTGGYSGDNGQATAAELSFPSGVAVDSAGDLFIADSSNERIREVVKATGKIITAAGNGTYGFSGDGGLATSTATELADPVAVAVDAAGDLFIAGGARVREVNHATGVITTVAGNGTAGYAGDNGPATAAELNYRDGIAVDAAGNLLFIADYDNERIREVNLTTGKIITVAGNGTAGYAGDSGQATAAELNYPSGVAVDTAGDLFIADQNSARIREVDRTTGVITTVAGNGTAGYAGNNGPATAAELSLPSGVAVDSTGNLFIADQYEHRVREVNYATGVITTVAGTGIQGYGGDNGQATAAELNYPSGVVVDAAGNVFIADTDDNRIRVLASGAAAVTVTGDPWVVIATGAFFGPGTTGLAWQNQVTGLVALWDNSGGVRINATFPGAPNPAVWKFLGTGDFNGDGTTDLLWQDQDPGDANYGLVAMWLMDSAGSGSVKTFVFPKTLAPSTWKFLSVGNFAGNGITDVAWRDENTNDAQNGLVGIWVMNSSGGVSSIAFPGTATPATWKLLGVGDFNGDGTADLAWQDQNSSDSLNGLVAMWLMSKNSPGATSSITFPGTVPPATWKLLGMADFAGNGTAGLAWQDQNPNDGVAYGLVATWLINTSGTLSRITFVGTVPPTIGTLLAIADFNQDGTADLVWQDVNSSDSTYGLVGFWLLNDGSWSQATFPSGINPSNMQLTVGNAVGDAPPDLIWHNLATGQVLDWQIQSNASVVKSSVLGTA